MRAVVFTLMFMAAALASAATIYKWVDENGVTHYSDQPHPGAQKIQVEAAQTYKGSSSQARSSASAAPPPKTASAPTYSCSVSRPAAQEMFPNTDMVPASVHVEPPLRPTDRLFVTLDGAAVPATVSPDAEFDLTSVLRGAHQLAARIEDASGATLCQSQPVPFYVRQASVLAPNSPLAPNAPPLPNLPLRPH
jgi:hypothetical protein